MKDFYNQKGVGRNKEFILGKKVGYYKLTFLQGHQADCLTSANQVIPDQLV